MIEMKCPLETPDHAQVLLDYCDRKLGPESTAVLERHIQICPSCRRFAEGQRAVWAALDSWDAAPVSADFDRRLYQRIENDVSWWERLARPFRPLMVYRGLPIAAAACLVIVAAVMVELPGRHTGPANPEVGVVDVQPEQVEQALDAMDMLSEFSHKVRSEGSDSKL